MGSLLLCLVTMFSLLQMFCGDFATLLDESKDGSEKCSSDMQHADLVDQKIEHDYESDPFFRRPGHSRRQFSRVWQESNGIAPSSVESMDRDDFEGGRPQDWEGFHEDPYDFDRDEYASSNLKRRSISDETVSFDRCKQSDNFLAASSDLDSGKSCEESRTVAARSNPGMKAAAKRAAELRGNGKGLAEFSGQRDQPSSYLNSSVHSSDQEFLCSGRVNFCGGDAKFAGDGDVSVEHLGKRSRRKSCEKTSDKKSEKKSKKKKKISKKERKRLEKAMENFRKKEPLLNAWFQEAKKNEEVMRILAGPTDNKKRKPKSVESKDRNSKDAASDRSFSDFEKDQTADLKQAYSTFIRENGEAKDHHKPALSVNVEEKFTDDIFVTDRGKVASPALQSSMLKSDSKDCDLKTDSTLNEVHSPDYGPSFEGRTSNLLYIAGNKPILDHTLDLRDKNLVSSRNLIWEKNRSNSIVKRALPSSRKPRESQKLAGNNMIFPEIFANPIIATTDVDGDEEEEPVTVKVYESALRRGNNSLISDLRLDRNRSPKLTTENFPSKLTAGRIDSKIRQSHDSKFTLNPKSVVPESQKIVIVKNPAVGKNSESLDELVPAFENSLYYFGTPKLVDEYYGPQSSDVRRTKAEYSIGIENDHDYLKSSKFDDSFGPENADASRDVNSSNESAFSRGKGNRYSRSSKLAGEHISPEDSSYIATARQNRGYVRSDSSVGDNLNCRKFVINSLREESSPNSNELAIESLGSTNSERKIHSAMSKRWINDASVVQWNVDGLKSAVTDSTFKAELDTADIVANIINVPTAVLNSNVTKSETGLGLPAKSNASDIDASVTLNFTNTDIDQINPSDTSEQSKVVIDLSVTTAETLKSDMSKSAVTTNFVDKGLATTTDEASKVVTPGVAVEAAVKTSNASVLIETKEDGASASSRNGTGNESLERNVTGNSNKLADLSHSSNAQRIADIATSKQGAWSDSGLGKVAARKSDLSHFVVRNGNSSMKPSKKGASMFSDSDWSTFPKNATALLSSKMAVSSDSKKSVGSKALDNPSPGYHGTSCLAHDSELILNDRDGQGSSDNVQLFHNNEDASSGDAIKYSISSVHSGNGDKCPEPKYSERSTDSNSDLADGESSIWTSDNLLNSDSLNFGLPAESYKSKCIQKRDLTRFEPSNTLSKSDAKVDSRVFYSNQNTLTNVEPNFFNPAIKTSAKLQIRPDLEHSELISTLNPNHRVQASKRSTEEDSGKAFSKKNAKSDLRETYSRRGQNANAFNLPAHESDHKQQERGSQAISNFRRSVPDFVGSNNLENFLSRDTTRLNVNARSETEGNKADFYEFQPESLNEGTYLNFVGRNNMEDNFPRAASNVNFQSNPKVAIKREEIGRYQLEPRIRSDFKTAQSEFVDDSNIEGTLPREVDSIVHSSSETSGLSRNHGVESHRKLFPRKVEGSSAYNGKHNDETLKVFNPFEVSTLKPTYLRELKNLAALPSSKSPRDQVSDEIKIPPEIKDLLTGNASNTLNDDVLDDGGPNELDMKVEDIISGKVPNRLVDTILAKVDGCGKMGRELGLGAPPSSCYENIEDLTLPANHHETEVKGQAEKMMGIIMRQITKLIQETSRKQGCYTLKPDLLNFLRWLLTPTSKRDMDCRQGKSCRADKFR